MGSPFTITSVSNYNSNPPSDDGSQTASNRLQWSTHISKIGNPIKTAFDSSETATSTAFGKIIGGAGITTTAVDYTVAASDQGKIVKVTASGHTITTPDATVVGSPFVFGVLNNSTGDITLDGNGSQTVDGDLNFTIPAGCGCLFNTDGSNWVTFGRNFNNVLQEPGGYLTLTSFSDNPIISGDVTAATSVYYTPYKYDRCPISTDGATFKMRQFSQLTLSLVSNHLANTIYDVFLFDNSGVTTIGTGPAWNNSTAGSSARGTGAGTTEIHKIHGLLVNVNSMTARNGATTYTVAANQGTFVGSIYIDGTAGQITCHVSVGQSRKWGVSNAYWRNPIVLQVADPTASWTYNTNTTRSSNGSTANSLTTLTCLAEEEIETEFVQFINSTASANSNGYWTIGIGWNSNSAFSGMHGLGGLNAGTGSATIQSNETGVVKYTSPPSLGINQAFCLETSTVGTGSSSVTYLGTSASMLLKAKYRG